MSEFVPFKGNPALRVGMVLRDERSGRFHRVTHCFDNTIFMMEIWLDAARCRDAKRPVANDASDVALARKAYLVAGSIALPAEMSSALRKGSDEYNECLQQKDLLDPLLLEFQLQSNLRRDTFTSLINQRASVLTMSEKTLRRLLFRFWYFGGVLQSLRPLHRGPKAAGSVPIAPIQSAASSKRRGRQPRLAAKLGKVVFSPEPVDVEEMVLAVAAETKRGASTWSGCHDRYMADFFAERHKVLYKKYINKSAAEPLTLRQFRRRVGLHEELPPRVRRFVDRFKKTLSSRSLSSIGAGDIYELDATGGQIAIVDSRDHSRVLRLVTIYLLIDRASRYVVSVFATLSSPSSDALRTVLRISFTSRSRFKAIGFDIDDKRWLPGVVPAHIVVDQGSDMVSKQMLKMACEGLLIDVDVLPALTPDGKAIVERVIRTLKERMKSRKLRGSYAKYIMSPQAASHKKRAIRAACVSLREFYLVLLEEVMKYNNAPHRGLKKFPHLAAAGVPHTPHAVYQFSLANHSGVQRPPLSDEDYLRLTMRRETAILRNGVLHWRQFKYHPSNADAKRFAGRAVRRETPMEVLCDGAYPVEFFGSSPGQEQTRWLIDQAGQRIFTRLMFEEIEQLADERGAVQAEAEGDARIARVSDRRKSSDRGQRMTAESPATIARSAAESRELAAALGVGGKTRKRAAEPAKQPAPLSRIAKKEQDYEAQIIMARRRQSGKEKQ